MKEMTLHVGGMKCDGCEATIRKALLKLDGIFDARANHKTGRLWLQVHESRFSISKVDETIRGLGYAPEAYGGSDDD